MLIEALEGTLVSTLREELKDLSSKLGHTGHWIYVDFPRLDAKMPRISLSLTGSRETPAGIGAEINDPAGNLGVLEETSFDIDIWVHRTNKSTGLSPERGGTALRDYLGDRVTSILLGKRLTLRESVGILDIEKIGEIVHPFDEDMELLRKTISIRVTHIRTYS